MDKSELKKPKKGAVARLRESYNKLRKQPVSSELKELFESPSKGKRYPSDKKVAKTFDPNSDVGI